jgi:hypothetical protein
MRNNYNISERVIPAWFIELKEKYPTLWGYGKKNSKPNGKVRNVLIGKMKGKQQYNSIHG